MVSNGKIEISNSLKAYIETSDLILVDRTKILIFQEARMYFEICLAIAMCFLGVTISNFQIWVLVMTILFCGLSFFFLIRFLKLNKVGKLIELDGIFKYGL